MCVCVCVCVLYYTHVDPPDEFVTQEDGLALGYQRVKHSIQVKRSGSLQKVDKYASVSGHIRYTCTCMCMGRTDFFFILV